MTSPTDVITKAATVLSKTLSGDQVIVSLQSAQGAVHSLHLTKEEAAEYELGDRLSLSVTRSI